mgnify:CR=1 FL=1
MKNIFAVILILTFFSSHSFSEETNIKGNYEVIGSTEGLKGNSQIELIELFNYSCGHCYKFLETSKPIPPQAPVTIADFPLNVRFIFLF